MRNLVEWSVFALLAAAPAPAMALELEFDGHLRAGVGLNARGGGQVCFGLAGADSKYRLGNECDYVIEPRFTTRFAKLEDQSAWGVVLMPGASRTYSSITSLYNLPMELREAYFFGENVPMMLHGRIWGGRRYYDRLHLEINDQFLENEDGDGAGVEDMSFEIGKLSLAFLMNPNDESTGTVNSRRFKLTARLTDVKTTEKGAVQVWLGYYGDSHSENLVNGTTPAALGSMFRFAVYHVLGGILGGSNLVGAKGEAGKNHLLWRGVLEQTFFISPIRTGIQFLTEFRQKRDRQDASSAWVRANWFTIGARTDTQIVGPLHLLIEAGDDYVLRQDADAQNLAKVTAALAVSAGIVPWPRPTFRLFYTHAFWNAAAKEAGGVFDHPQSGARLAQVYGNATSGGSFGIHAEAWW